MNENLKPLTDYGWKIRDTTQNGAHLDLDDAELLIFEIPTQNTTLISLKIPGGLLAGMLKEGNLTGKAILEDEHSILNIQFNAQVNSLDEAINETIPEIIMRAINETRQNHPTKGIQA